MHSRHTHTHRISSAFKYEYTVAVLILAQLLMAKKVRNRTENKAGDVQDRDRQTGRFPLLLQLFGLMWNTAPFLLRESIHRQMWPLPHDIFPVRGFTLWATHWTASQALLSLTHTTIHASNLTTQWAGQSGGDEVALRVKLTRSGISYIFWSSPCPLPSFHITFSLYI